MHRGDLEYIKGIISSLQTSNRIDIAASGVIAHVYNRQSKFVSHQRIDYEVSFPPQDTILFANLRHAATIWFHEPNKEEAETWLLKPLQEDKLERVVFTETLPTSFTQPLFREAEYWLGLDWDLWEVCGIVWFVSYKHVLEGYDLIHQPIWKIASNS